MVTETGRQCQASRLTEEAIPIKIKLNPTHYLLEKESVFESQGIQQSKKQVELNDESDIWADVHNDRQELTQKPMRSE